MSYLDSLVSSSVFIVFINLSYGFVQVLLIKFCCLQIIYRRKQKVAHCMALGVVQQGS